MTEREKFFKEMSLDGEPIVRSHIHIGYQFWQEFGNKLNWLENFSSNVTVSIDRNPSRPAGSEWTDVWGCRWYYPIESHDGQCIEHPIISWNRLKDYIPPDPEKFTDWKKTEEDIKNTKLAGRVAHGGTDHGFIFLRLTYLRGFNNLMMDIADERPELDELISIIEEYWYQVVKRWVDIGADIIGFGDYLGLQNALPISPDAWRRYIKPSYKRIMSYCRSHGVHTALHSDGYIVDVIPDLIECGVTRLNPQDIVNGLDNLANLAKGKVYIHLDIDRQKLTVFGNPDEIEQHIYNCIKKLGSPKGGLSCIWYVFPPTPIENINAVAKAMDKYANLWEK